MKMEFTLESQPPSMWDMIASSFDIGTNDFMNGELKFIPKMVMKEVFPMRVT